MNENVLEIISRRKLGEFLLGIGEFFTERPNVDYSRWYKVKTVYIGLPPNNSQKKYIEETILNLVASFNPEEKRIGIVVGRLIGLPALREILRRLILDDDFDKLPVRVKDEICVSATLMQIKEVGLLLVSYFFSENRIRDFIFCSHTPPYIHEVKDDDIWRIKIVSKYYISSSQKNQKIILDEIEGCIKDSQNFRLAIHMFVQKENENTKFRGDVLKILNTS